MSVPPVPREGEIVGLVEPFKEYGDGDGGVNTSLFHRGQRQLALPAPLPPTTDVGGKTDWRTGSPILIFLPLSKFDRDLNNLTNTS